MAWLSGATQSGKQFYQGQPGTSFSAPYTSPAASINTTNGSATAIIKEIVLTNTNSGACTVNVFIGGSAGSNAFVYALTINPNDTKIIGGLNTMLPPSTPIEVSQGTASAITVTISGVEIQ